MGDLNALLLEGPENAVDELRLHTFAGIVDPDHQIRHAAFQHHLPEGDGDLTFFCKFHCIE